MKRNIVLVMKILVVSLIFGFIPQIGCGGGGGDSDSTIWVYDKFGNIYSGLEITFEYAGGMNPAPCSLGGVLTQNPLVVSSTGRLTFDLMEENFTSVNLSSFSVFIDPSMFGSSSGAQVIVISKFISPTDSTTGLELEHKANKDWEAPSSDRKYGVIYFFTDKDVDLFHNNTFPNVPNFNLSLKRGWNIIIDDQVTNTLEIASPSKLKECRWVIIDYP